MVDNFTCFYSPAKQLQCPQYKILGNNMINAKKIEEIAKNIEESIINITEKTMKP